MPIRKKPDFPGAWWNLTNRGIAKRTTFESVADIERFCELLAEVSRRGLLEVHAYTFLTTHYHLLVRSPLGRLPDALQWVLLQYVRWFNRARRRDGSLFCGRYRGRRIDDSVYWEAVLRYIDLNPVRAGMCATPGAYPHGSAAAYAGAPSPPWLVRSEVEATVADAFNKPRFDAADYDPFVAAVDPTVVARIVEITLRGNQIAVGPRMDDLVRAASLREQGWMEWKAALADGTRPGLVILPPDPVDRVVRAVNPLLRRCSAAQTVGLDLSRTLRAGLLLDLAAMKLSPLALRLGVSVATAHRAVESHRRLCKERPAYLELVQRLVAMLVRRTLPPASRALDLPRHTGADLSAGRCTAVAVG